jgi:hypothetical protein
MRLHTGLRAAAFLAFGLLFTFRQQHGPTWAVVQLYSFGFCLVIANLLPIAVKKHRTEYRSMATLWVPELLLASGLVFAAAMNPFGNEGGTYGYYVQLVSVWGFLNFANASYQAFAWRKDRLRRIDSVIAAGINLALGTLFAFAPLGAIPAVGFAGAYFVVVGVLLGISAASVNNT